MKELETLDTNSWHLTNSIPLTPDKAVISAISYLELKYPKSENFSVDKIEILQWGEHWYYQIAFFKKRNDGAIVNQECVYVLLSGKVWQPKVEIENN